MQEKTLARVLRAHAARLAPGHRMAWASALYAYSEYRWGEEEVGGADCSGLVCGALRLLGYPLRVNADELYRRWSLRIEGRSAVPGDLAFWWGAGEDAERITHVAVFVAPSLLVNATPPEARFDHVLDEVERRRAQKIEGRTLNWEALDELRRGSGRMFGTGRTWESLRGVLDE